MTTKKTTKKTETTKATKTETKKTETTKKLTASEQRDAFIKTLKLTERIVLENETVATNKDSFAMLTNDNATMLYLVSEDSTKATRLVEVWGHKNRIDVCISKKHFENLCNANKDFETYSKLIDKKAKSSKHVFKIANYEDATKFVNAIIKAS